MVSVHEFEVAGDGVTDDAPKIQEALDDSSVTELTFAAGKTYRLASSCQTINNERPYLWIRRSNLHIDLNGAMLLVDPLWSTSTPPGADDAYPVPGTDSYRGRWKPTSAAAFNIGYYTGELTDISLSNGTIKGYGKQVEWRKSAKLQKDRKKQKKLKKASLAATAPEELGRRADVVGARAGFDGVRNLQIHGVHMADMFDGVQLVKANDVHITGCHFSQCHRQACSITGVESALISRCGADSCGHPLANGDQWLAIPPEVSNPQPVGAFHIEPAGDEKVGDVLFERNAVVNGQIGFAIQRSATSEDRSVKRVTVNDNVVIAAKNRGIVMKQVQDWSIADNKLILCALGIEVDNKCLGPDPSVGVVNGNTCVGAHGTAGPTDGHGIAVIGYNEGELQGRGSDAKPLHVVVADNNCHSNAHSGILLSDAWDSVCERNLCFSNVHHGIWAYLSPPAPEGSYLVIRSNRCGFNKQTGILCRYPGPTWLTQNTCFGNVGHGIEFDPPNPTDVVTSFNIEAFNSMGVA